MDNQTIFSSLQQTPSFPYETDKMQGNSHLEIWVPVSQHWYRHRHRHFNITMVF